MNPEEMTIEELMGLREEIQQKIDELREEYVNLGKILDLKVRASRLPSKDEIAAKEAELVQLKQIQAELGATKLGGK